MAIGVSAGMVVGVPIASFIASAVSLQMAMVFFAAVNMAVFIATLLFVPSLPVQDRASYGEQLSILKKSATWLSIVAIIFLNSAIFGVYSYLAEYLKTVTNMPANMISLLLFVYGGANMVGNIVAGKLLSKHAIPSIMVYPFVLGAVYVLLFFTGQLSLPTAVITLIWGILAGIGANMNQYLMTSAAPYAPDFANGLFLTSANLGVTIGAPIGGLVIAEWGTQYVVFVGILSLGLGLIALVLRNHFFKTAGQLAK